MYQGTIALVEFTRIQETLGFDGFHHILKSARISKTSPYLMSFVEIYDLLEGTDIYHGSLYLVGIFRDSLVLSWIWNFQRHSESSVNLGFVRIEIYVFYRTYLLKSYKKSQIRVISQVSKFTGIPLHRLLESLDYGSSPESTDI